MFDALATLMTMPLARVDAGTKVPTALCPVIVIKGQRLHALAHYAAQLPAKTLRRPVGSVVAQASVLDCPGCGVVTNLGVALHLLR